MPSFPTIDDSRITQDAPLDQSLLEDLKARDDWNQFEADNGGSGIEPSVTQFESALVHHYHNGGDGQGENIPTAGIANGAASAADMWQDESVTTGKIGNTAMTTQIFQDGSVTADKNATTIGRALSGTESYDTTGEPREGIDEVYLGDVMIVSHGKGSPGVVCNPSPTTSIDPAGQVDWHVLSQGSGSVRFGLVYPGEGSGTWDVSAWLM